MVNPYPLASDNSVVLISCVSLKGTDPAEARLLYRSPWFKKARELVEARQASYWILSALHGVVDPHDKIAPYDTSLNNASAAERRIWAARTFKQLMQVVGERRKVIIFAGKRYRQFLVPLLLNAGCQVEVPMANLGIGKQLAWLEAQK